MTEKSLTTAIFMALSCLWSPIHAQFNTIRDLRGAGYEILTPVKSVVQINDNKSDTIAEDIELPTVVSETNLREKDVNSGLIKPVRKKHLDYNIHYEGLPDLTLNNLLQEIRKCGIQHEKVVLAQAILETGWFTSPVCRNKNNLFGLTNPRTGQYYEFNHWTESVKAYYTKVQYRYKGGNYLLWLDKIGYAEAKTYVASLIRLMRQYFI